MELRKRLHEPIAKTAAWMYSALEGHNRFICDNIADAGANLSA
jgi:hypothetical protein